MDKRWYEISHTHEQWTIATWLLFAALFCVFSYLFLHASGFFDDWVEFLNVSGKATAEVAAFEGPRANQSGSATGFMIVMIGYSFVVPVVLAMLPTVSAQWWIMRKLGRKPKRRRRGPRRAGIVISYRGG